MLYKVPHKVLRKVPYEVLYKVPYKVSTGGPGPGSHEKASDVLGKQREREVAETPAHRSGQGAAETTPAGFTSTLGLTQTPVPRSIAKTVWPSGLGRWLQASVRKGVGSIPTAVTLLARGRRVDLEGLIPFEGGGGLFV